MVSRFVPRALLLAWVAGFALGESGPPRDAWAPAFAYGAALQLALGPCVAARRTVVAGLIGLASGIGFGCSALVWLAPAVERFAPNHAAWAWPGTVAAIGLSSLAPALGAALYAASARGRGDALRFAVSMALAFTAVPMLFPYRPIAMALPLLPAGAWLGAGGASVADVLVLLPGCLFVAAWERHQRGLVVRGAVMLALALGLGTLETVRADRARAAAPPIHLGVVQSNVTIEAGRDRTRRQERLERLRAHTSVLASQAAEVVLWPESAYPFALDRLARREPRRRVTSARGTPACPSSSAREPSRARARIGTASSPSMPSAAFAGWWTRRGACPSPTRRWRVSSCARTRVGAASSHRRAKHRRCAACTVSAR